MQAPANLGLSTREAFRTSAAALLDEMPEGSGQLVVDFAATKDVDSAGLSALVMTQRHAAAKDVDTRRIQVQQFHVRQRDDGECLVDLVVFHVTGGHAGARQRYRHRSRRRGRKVHGRLLRVREPCMADDGGDEAVAHAAIPGLAMQAS